MQWGPLLPKEGGMIHVDIGGHPHIPFGPAPSILAAVDFQQNLLFLAGFGTLMTKLDIDFFQPIRFEIPPSVLSVFQFHHNLLFLVVFRVLNFQSHLEALNDIFWESCLRRI